MRTEDVATINSSKIKKTEKAKAIESTHKELEVKLMEAASSYSEADKISRRYAEVKAYFEALTSSQPHTGVKISEIDISQNDRNINLLSEEFLALKESIHEHGLLQRPVLTLGFSGDKPFLCVAGHRRILAYKELGHSLIPAELIFSSEEKQIRLARLSENLVREDLKPLELAEAVFRLKDSLNESTAGVARLLKKNREYITRLLKIAQWPQNIKDIILANQIGMWRLLEIAMRSLTEEQILKKLQESQKPSGGSSNSKDVTGSHAYGKFVEKRDSYFAKNNLSVENQQLIINFLKDNQIRNWY